MIAKQTIFVDIKNIVRCLGGGVDSCDIDRHSRLIRSAIAIAHFISERIGSKEVLIRRVSKRSVRIEFNDSVGWTSNRRGVDRQCIAIDIAIVGQQLIAEHTIFIDIESVVACHRGVVDRYDINYHSRLSRSAIAIAHFISERIPSKEVGTGRVSKRSVRIKFNDSVGRTSNRRGVDRQCITIDIAEHQFTAEHAVFLDTEITVRCHWGVVDRVDNKCKCLCEATTSIILDGFKIECADPVRIEVRGSEGEIEKLIASHNQWKSFRPHRLPHKK